VFSTGWHGRIISLLIAYFLPIVIGVKYFYTKGYLSGSFRVKYFLSEFKSLLPILLLQTNIFILTGADKLIVSYFYGESVTGAYSVATNFSSVFFVFGTVLQMYFQPFLYKELAEGAGVSFLLSQFKKYMGFAVLFILLLSVFIVLSYRFLLKQDYKETILYCFITLSGFFFWVLTNFLQLYLFITDNIGLYQLCQ